MRAENTPARPRRDEPGSLGGDEDNLAQPGHSLNPPATLTLDDIAVELRCSKRNTIGLRSRGRLPDPLPGLRPLLRWRRDEILGWLAAGAPPREQWAAISDQSGGQP